jgi:hypothetical protein
MFELSDNKRRDDLTLIAQQNLLSLSKAARRQQHRLLFVYGKPLQQPIRTFF